MFCHMPRWTRSSTKRAHRLVERRQPLIGESLEVVLVRVPAAEIDLDADGTLFDQLAGEQAAFAEIVVPVLFEIRLLVIRLNALPAGPATSPNALA